MPPATDPPPGARLALVVATSTYTDPELRRLRAPAQDAADLAQVLADPDIGGFTVTTLIDQPAQQIRLAVEDFLADRGTGDLLLVYLSCHGMLDARRRLYFAAADTRKDRLGSTGVESAWVLDQLEHCRARRQVLILDSCFSGAFAHGAKGESDLDLRDRFLGQGRGRVVLTASAATEYSFEGEPTEAAATPGGSVFTAALVHGLRTGAADTDHDGHISVDDAYAYVFDQVQATGAAQTPQRWLYGAEGRIVLARNPAGPTRPSPELNEQGPKLLGGRYELGEVVGRGGMAEVYRAHDIRLDRIVAVKVLRADLARDRGFRTRFRREAGGIAASLNHPSIVAVYDTGEDKAADVPLPYIVMEYIDGYTVRDLLQEGHLMLWQRSLEIIDGALRALDYGHQAGIVHGDIKPGHLMVTRNGDVKVIDFGIARAMSDAQATMTQTAQVIGTAHYLSPEQARGERVDSRSDLYSTGCLLYELLTGRPPFTGDSPVAIAYQHVWENPVPPSRVNPDVPPWADAIMLKAMAKSPADRYQTAADMHDGLQRAVFGIPVAIALPTLLHMYPQTQRTETASRPANGENGG